MSLLRNALMPWLLGLLACQHLVPVGAPPASQGLYDNVCTALVQEQGLASDQEVLVLESTGAIYHMIALQSYYSGGSLRPSEIGPDIKRQRQLEASFRSQKSPRPPKTSGCNWRYVDSTYEELRFSNELLLDLSNPIDNPYVGGESPARGRFARFSLGGRPGASWLWISLHERDGQWVAGDAVLLDVSDS